MVSGACRIVTLRSPCAPRARAITDSASIRYAIARTRRVSSRSPSRPTPSTPRVSNSSASSSVCCSGVRIAHSRTTSSARHSLTAPTSNAPKVIGIRWTRASAIPRCWDPRDGDSRRANAT